MRLSESSLVYVWAFGPPFCSWKPHDHSSLPVWRRAAAQPSPWAQVTPQVPIRARGGTGHVAVVPLTFHSCPQPSEPTLGTWRGTGSGDWAGLWDQPEDLGRMGSLRVRAYEEWEGAVGGGLEWELPG